LDIYRWVEKRQVLVVRRFVRNQVRRRRNILRVRSLVFMCMKREPSLKVLLLVLKAVVVIMMAILFSRRGPQPLVLGPRGQAPPMKLEIDMMKT
jgi:hypothetical protein